MNSLVDQDIRADLINLDDAYHAQIIAYSIGTVSSLIVITDFFIGHPQYSYRDPVGAHIRHLIDHYNALLKPNASVINYDLRERSPELERDPSLARKQLLETVELIKEIDVEKLNQALWICATGGEKGTFQMRALSSMGRELIFFNSHTVHHLAIIKSHCQSIGMPTEQNFGIAPSTVAYQIQQPQEQK